MKRGLVGTVILVVIGVLVLSIAGAGIYFYNYHVFKEVRVCVGEGENLGVPCESDNECLSGFNLEFKMDDVPEFLEKYFDTLLERAVYCDETCFLSEIRGIDFESGELEELDSCFEDEEELVFEIKGKEGFEILMWARDKDN
ncbi:hypothetical protein HNV12_04200 [Methanococcoides sp. SA1]|nr:hypothetical protein [Methanococcoides sp. SA1]